MVGFNDRLYQRSLQVFQADYFLAQQKDLGAVNGYIEEMMDRSESCKSFLS